MTRNDALLALEQGKKVTHKNLTVKYIVKHGYAKRASHYTDNKGSVFTASNFWKWRRSGDWNVDWELYLPRR